jgi:hypothetical protein
MSTITVTPIAGSLGAEVRDVDLRTMDNQASATVHQVRFPRAIEIGVNKQNSFSQRVS